MQKIEEFKEAFIKTITDEEVKLTQKQYEKLNPIEKKVCGLILKGLDWKEIAQKMNCGENKVNAIRKNVFIKLDTTSRTQTALKLFKAIFTLID